MGAEIQDKFTGKHTLSITIIKKSAIFYLKAYLVTVYGLTAYILSKSDAGNFLPGA